MDEHRAIRRVQASGDRAAADHLVRLHYDEVLAFVRRQVRDEEEAVDLTQETLISMLRTIAYYDRRKSGFRTWLFRIATNKVIDAHRARSARPLVVRELDETDLVNRSDLTAEIEGEQLTRRVNAHLVRHPVRTQQIFRLHVFGGYTFAEIAHELGISDNTAKTSYYRLVRQLRKELADDFDR